MNASTTEPRVVAVMLTRDRGAMAHRAAACFRAQTYSNKRLLILDNSEFADGTLPYGQADATSVWMPDMRGKTVGELRNAANWCALDWGEAEIIIHLDSDDFSHPARFSEQVALLLSSKADAVGFHEMLFWREPITTAQFTALVSPLNPPPGEAWIYSAHNPTHVLGTSLCYWRKTWERKPFEATSQGEDCRFISGLKVAAVSGIGGHGCGVKIANFPPVGDRDIPRMIARIHPGNTSAAYDPAKMKRHKEWTRVPEWDSYCVKVMA